MGKRRIIAETGAGQHGVATATVCARFGLECVVYMGEEDIRRQKLNVFRMQHAGREVVPVSAGSRTLKDAMNEAIRDWVTNVEDTHYIIGSAAGPHPYPMLVRDFQAVIGREARAQMLERDGRLPDASSPASAAAPTRSASSTRSSATRGASCTAPRRAATARPRRHAASLEGAGAACCTARAATCCRTTTARCSRATPSRPASTIPASARSTPT